jgi:hypothetical protein
MIFGRRNSPSGQGKARVALFSLSLQFPIPTTTTYLPNIINIYEYKVQQPLEHLVLVQSSAKGT